MKLETTVTEKYEIEIPTPSFYKDNSCSKSINDMRGILDEKTYCQIWESEARTCVVNADVSMMKSEIVEAFKKWQPISEEEFIAAYDRALHFLSLTPELSKESKLI